jgi:hypothetical protein
MNSYKDEMYKFIAARENFEVASEIHNLFPSVKERMISEFWAAVKEKLDELNDGKKWIVEYVQADGIYIYKDNWETWVRVENIDKSASYGVSFNQDKFDEKLFDENKGRALLEKNDNVECMEKGKDWWFYREVTEDNFQEIATLKKITFDNKEDFVNEWANLLFDLANDTEEDLTKINKTKT